MHAITAQPGQKDAVSLEEVPHPDRQDGALLVRGRQPEDLKVVVELTA